MTEIDELEGEALAAAVAVAQGWAQDSYPDWWDAPDGGRWAWAYRPDLNIAQAWELLEGFVYAIDNYEWRLGASGHPIACYLRNDSGSWLGHGDRVEEAICRAFLKAKAAQ